jgi:hypothetical protein
LHDLQKARIDSLLGMVDNVLAALARSSSQLREEVNLLSGLPPGDRDRTVRALEELGRENDQLREALAARAPIEQAKGVLVARLGCDPEEAFTLLCALSRERRRKVRELAVEIVTSRGRILDDRPGDPGRTAADGSAVIGLQEQGGTVRRARPAG